MGRLCLLLLMLTPAPAAELQLHFTAIQKILAAQVFTDEGRLYVRANRNERCNFAYLKDPQVSEENGRLKVRAQFTGRSAQNLLGLCVGMGDSFPLTFTAIPYYENGMIRLKEIMVSSEGRDSYYIRHVRASFLDSLNREFRYNFREAAKRLLEERPATAVYAQEVSGFEVKQLRVTPEGIILTVDFNIAVK